MTTLVETEQPIELVKDKLYRLGGVVEVDGRISWIPPDVSGFEPMNCYLLKDGDSALLVETGVPYHQDLVLEQLRTLIGDQTPLSIFVTRFEPDCLTNLASIIANFNVNRVFGGGVSNPFDFFDDLSAEEQIRQDYKIELQRKKPGEVVPVSDSRDLTLVVTTIRLLTTFWAYDAETKTLFTSDSFGHCQMGDANEAPVIDASNDTATLDTVRNHLLTKFDWLKGAETPPLQDDLKNIFETYDVEIIAPTHGAVLKGKDVITRHYEFTQQVLGEIHND